MIRLYPDMRKGHLFKKIKFFNQLKNRHSESFLLDLDDESFDRKFMELKKQILLKTSDYKPLLKKYMRTLEMVNIQVMKQSRNLKKLVY